MEAIDHGEGPAENGRSVTPAPGGATKRLVADKTLEADLFKGALQKVGARRKGNKQPGGTASMTKSGN